MKKSGPCILISLLFFTLSLSVSAFPDDQKLNNKNTNDENKSPARVIIADFNKGDMANNLGGEIGEWELDPEDNAQGLGSSFDNSVKNGASGSSFKISRQLACYNLNFGFSQYGFISISAIFLFRR